MFVKTTLKNGNIAYLNTDAIASIVGTTEGSLIYFTANVEDPIKDKHDTEWWGNVLSWVNDSGRK